MSFTSNGNAAVRSPGQFSGKGLGGNSRPAAGAMRTQQQQQPASDAGAPGAKKGKRPTHNVKVKDLETGKYRNVGAIFENTMTITDKSGASKEITTQTLTVKEDLQPGTFYSVFVNDYQDKA